MRQFWSVPGASGYTRGMRDFETSVVSRRGLARGVLGLAFGLAVAVPAQAAVVFADGFESGDTSAFDYDLNPEGLSVVIAPEPVLAGTHALKAELTAQTVWDNGIFRTEIQRVPREARVLEGTEIYFGWSVYLPKALPTGDYQLGYFETRSTYNQVFSLHARGSDLFLYMNHSAPDSPSNHPGLLEVGKWHRIVYHVKSSADPAVGFVSLWWDGVKLVDQMHGKTFVDTDGALVQIGLLKNPPEPPEPVVLYLDEVAEGDSYADVSAGIAEVVAAVPVPPTDIVAPPTGTTSDVAPTTAPTVIPLPVAPAPAPAPASGSSGGCDVSNVGGTSRGAWALLLGVAALVGREVRRRTGARTRR